MEHKGLNTHRLAGSPLESAFAAEWESHNAAYDTLAWILGGGNGKSFPSERDAQVAATVIQWLGSPIGQNFVERVLGPNAPHKPRSEAESA